MKNLFIVFFCLVSVLAIKANGQESLWKIQAVDYQGTYYGAAVANGGIGILPWKEPFSVRHVMLNHVIKQSGFTSSIGTDDRCKIALLQIQG